MQVTALVAAQRAHLAVPDTRPPRRGPPFASAAREVTSAAAAAATAVAWRTSLRFIDIGASLLDPMFQGVYRGKQQHPADLRAVLEMRRRASSGAS